MFFGLIQADGSAVLFSRQSAGFVLYSPGALTGASFSAVPVTAYGLNDSKVGGANGGTETGTVDGTATTSTGLGGATTTLAGIISGGDGTKVNFSATSNAASWNTAASASAIAGSYTGAFSVGSTAYTPSLTIAAASDGSATITGTDTTTTTCTYTGKVTTPDPVHNDYNVTLASSCLTGKNFSGIGAFFPPSLSSPGGILSKAQLKAGLTDGSTTGIYLNLTAK